MSLPAPLSPGVAKCQASINSYMRRTAPERINQIWLSLSERERASWLRVCGGADAVEHGMHGWNWADIPTQIQGALLDKWENWSKRARVISDAIAARKAAS